MEKAQIDVKALLLKKKSIIIRRGYTVNVRCVRRAEVPELEWIHTL